jgi:hypothetical protein
MTATIVPLFAPPPDTMQAVREARVVLHSPIKQDDRDLRTACHVLQTWGDTIDYMMARQMLLMLDRQDLARPEPDEPPAPALTFMLLTAAASVAVVGLGHAAWVLL